MDISQREEFGAPVNPSEQNNDNHNITIDESKEYYQVSYLRPRGI